MDQHAAASAWSRGAALRRAAPAAEALVLGRAYLLAGAVCGVTAAAPFSATAPRATGVVLAVVGVAGGALLVRHRRTVPVALANGLLALATLLIGWCVARATTPAGAAVTAASVTWVAVYSAAFHTRRVMAAHLALLGTTLAVALAAGPAVSPAQTWVFLMATAAGMAFVLHGRVDVLRSDASHDPLTGALSRRGFQHHALQQMALSARHGHPVTLALLDLDGFKQVNDAHGHTAGDAVLVALAREWRAALRPGDSLGRHGGDEFVLLLPSTDAAGAEALLDRLGRTVTVSRWSAGVAQWDGHTLEEWFEAADAHLYRAKAGRGRPA